jgi:hypothetical protein
MNHLHFLAAGVVCDACLCKSSLGMVKSRIQVRREGHHHRAHVPLALDIRRTLDHLLDERVLVKVGNDTRVDPETSAMELAKQKRFMTLFAVPSMTTAISWSAMGCGIKWAAELRWPSSWKSCRSAASQRTAFWALMCEASAMNSQPGRRTATR